MANAMKTHLTVEEVANRTGLTAYTLRYYERIGLIAPVRRAAGGHRRYAASDIDWIAFLLRLRATNMPIAMMQTFATLREQGDATVSERCELLERHLENTLAAIEAMRESAQALQAKIDHYRAMEQSHLQENGAQGSVSAKPLRQPGAMNGKMRIDDNFDTPLPDDVQAAFAGG